MWNLFTKKSKPTNQEIYDRSFIENERSKLGSWRQVWKCHKSKWSNMTMGCLPAILVGLADEMVELMDSLEKKKWEK